MSLERVKLGISNLVCRTVIDPTRKDLGWTPLIYYSDWSLGGWLHLA